MRGRSERVQAGTDWQLEAPPPAAPPPARTFVNAALPGMGAAEALPLVSPVAAADVSSTNLEATASRCLPVVTSPATKKAGVRLPAPNCLPPSGYGGVTRLLARPAVAACRLSGYALVVVTWQPLEMSVVDTTVVVTSPGNNEQGGKGVEPAGDVSASGVGRESKVRQTAQAAQTRPASQGLYTSFPPPLPGSLALRAAT